jgi:hypothetical protein
MKRKEFIRTAGAAALSAFFPVRLFSENNALNPPSWTALLDYARWTASPHNVQPWKIKIISETEAHLYYDPTRLLPVVDPTSCFTIAGFGMFIESLDIIAGKYGYKITAEYTSEPQLDYSAKTNKLFARLFLVKTDSPSLIDCELIKKRKTSRIHYNGIPANETQTKALAQIATAFGHQFNLTSDSKTVQNIVQLNGDTLFRESDYAPALNEVGHWVRSTDEEAEKTKDGLWYKCMGVPRKLLIKFFFQHQKYSKGFLRKEGEKIFIHSMKGTANLGWLSGPFQNKADWINSGRLLQQFWLELTKENLWLCPFGGIITDDIAHTQFLKLAGITETPQSYVWFLFRYGAGAEPQRSLRLEVNDILIS